MVKNKYPHLKLVRLLETDVISMDGVDYANTILEMEFNIFSGDCKYIIKYSDLKNKERELYFDNLKEAVEQFNSIIY